MIGLRRLKKPDAGAGQDLITYRYRVVRVSARDVAEKPVSAIHMVREALRSN